MRVFIATILFIGAAILWGFIMWLCYHEGHPGWTFVFGFFGALGVYDLAKDVLKKADLVHVEVENDSSVD